MRGEWQRLLGRPRGERKKVHIHLMGIGGAGLSAIATVLLEEGYTVSGCDRAPSALAEALARRGVVVHQGHDAAHLAGVDLLLASSAVPTDAPERLAAQAKGIPVVKREELLGEMMAGRTGIAVAGTHGKTTTTGMIAWILAQAGHDPTFIVGGTLPDLGTNARAGRGRAFVIEADEYDRMFLGLRPTVAVVTNVEWDHPDCYPTPEAFREAFAQFVARVSAGGRIIGCMDDAGVREVRQIATAAPALTLPRLALERTHEYAGEGANRTLGTEGLWEGYGFEPEAEWQATEIMPNARGGHDFTVLCRGVRVAQVNLSLAGKHNILNVLAALAAVAQVGVEPEQAAYILGFFQGAARRFEAKGEAGGIMVLDDYGHHPTEVRATLAAARQRFPGRTVWAVFQPHTFSRTRALLTDFAAAFNDADHVIITDIFPARERDNLGVTSAHIVERMNHPDARTIGSLDAAAGYLLQRLKSGDVLITLGAGDGNLVGERVLAGLRVKERIK
ncbi:MAG: UDP-N-acetylmuramate--L-alanine ligase [Anaerolineae bacterium]|nr:UDP-N-acetylmuramate--L-alanine ligase [Anaerolineae bacterium]